MADSNALEVLIQALRRLPGVGVKSASRMAFHLLQHDRPSAQALSGALAQAVSSVRHCEQCHTFTEAPVCTTCLDVKRDRSKLCVVETPADQSAIEVKDGDFWLTNSGQVIGNDATALLGGNFGLWKVANTGLIAGREYGI